MMLEDIFPTKRRGFNPKNSKSNSDIQLLGEKLFLYSIHVTHLSSEENVPDGTLAKNKTKQTQKP